LEGGTVEAGPASNFSKIEEYRLFIEDTARFSDRRQTASNFIIAANALLAAGLAALVGEVGSGGLWPPLVALLVAATGIAVCLIWLKLLTRYREMIDFRCDQLEQIESQIPDSHRMYRKLKCRFPDGGFSGVERWLPRAFIAVYSALAAGIVVGPCVGWWVRGLVAHC
jgi:hypothetical protein